MSDAAAAFHAFEHERWQSAAQAFHDNFGRLTSQVAAALLDTAHVQKGTRLLDVASGPGYVAGLAAARGAHVTGSDFSQEMVALAHRMLPTVEFRIENAERLSFGDRTFDAVTAAYLLGHLAEPERALSEAFRVLKPGGRFAAAWWLPVDRAVAFGIVLNAVTAHGSTDVGLPPGPPFDRYSDPDNARTALAAAGFAQVEVNPHAMTLRTPSAEALFDAFYHGTARTAGLLRGQSTSQLAAIRAAVIEHAEAYRQGDELVMPMPSWILSGTRP